MTNSSQSESRDWKEFYEEVCRRAESNMLKTGKLEGAHFAAMKQVKEEWLRETPDRVKEK